MIAGWKAIGLDGPHQRGGSRTGIHGRKTSDHRQRHRKNGPRPLKQATGVQRSVRAPMIVAEPLLLMNRQVVIMVVVIVVCVVVAIFDGLVMVIVVRMYRFKRQSAVAGVAHDEAGPSAQKDGKCQGGGQHPVGSSALTDQTQTHTRLGCRLPALTSIADRNRYASVERILSRSRDTQRVGYA